MDQRLQTSRTPWAGSMGGYWTRTISRYILHAVGECDAEVVIFPDLDDQTIAFYPEGPDFVPADVFPYFGTRAANTLDCTRIRLPVGPIVLIYHHPLACW